MSLSNKIDFAVVFTVKNANPNGDPLNGNRPRTTYEGFGEMSDVCIKRKIRNRWMQTGENILIQSDDNKKDEYTSIRSRVEAAINDDADWKKNSKNSKLYKAKASEIWLDVRAFGQVFAFSGKGADGLSIPVRGPVSIHPAFSLTPISVSSSQITKSCNSEDTKDGKKSSDTMGMKHRVDQGIYVFYGSINAQLASDETGTKFSDDDALKLKEALRTLFENDASSARPEGSMEVSKLIWWKHSCPHGDLSSAKVHKSLRVSENGEISVAPLKYKQDEQELELKPEIIDGF
ncbi:MAG: type I-C CRISPR-associated protein Cas7/Csd2 [Puniceicoccaceae bacterium]|nr:MAG: type I-C CRISPR-associated protein Cas7/Csd2 [Puniceicoccaceae bacterium]